MTWMLMATMWVAMRGQQDGERAAGERGAREQRNREGNGREAAKRDRQRGGAMGRWTKGRQLWWMLVAGMLVEVEAANGKRTHGAMALGVVIGAAAVAGRRRRKRKAMTSGKCTTWQKGVEVMKEMMAQAEQRAAVAKRNREQRKAATERAREGRGEEGGEWEGLWTGDDMESKREGVVRVVQLNVGGARPASLTNESDAELVAMLAWMRGMKVDVLLLSDHRISAKQEDAWTHLARQHWCPKVRVRYQEGAQMGESRKPGRRTER